MSVESHLQDEFNRIRGALVSIRGYTAAALGSYYQIQGRETPEMKEIADWTAQVDKFATLLKDVEKRLPLALKAAPKSDI